MSDGGHSLDVIIPVYNEQESILHLLNQLKTTLSSRFNALTFIIVDDGSTDYSLSEVRKFENSFNTPIKYIRLSRNHGKDLALKCGVDHADSDLCCFIDGDLQHPPEKLIEAYEKLKQGYNIVHIMKKEYETGRCYRRYSTKLFSRILNALSEYPIRITDFKLIDRKVIDLLKQVKESTYYNNGVIDMLGLKSATIWYEPQDRRYGKTKFNFVKLLNLSVFSIMSVSTKPLKLAIHLGLIISFFSFFYGLFIIFEKLFLGQPIPGFVTLAVAMLFLGGIQLSLMGIIGLYLGKTFIESKNRPQYIIEHIVDL